MAEQPIKKANKKIELKPFAVYVPPELINRWVQDGMARDMKITGEVIAINKDGDGNKVTVQPSVDS